MRAAALLMCTAILSNGSAVTAASDPPANCERMKVFASARAVGKQLVCHARAVQSAIPVDERCLGRAVARMVTSFERADRRGPCSGDATLTQREIDLQIGMLLVRVPGTGPCPARKLAVAGKKIDRRLRCRGRVALPLLPDCFADADARFVDAFARAERRGPCGGDPGTVESLADWAVNAIARPIVGPPPSTTSTTTTTIPGQCGNGMVDPGEQCDGQAYCAAGCRFGAIGCCVGSADAAFCADAQPTRQTCLFCLAAHGVCAPGACVGTACVDRAIPPVAVCCQFSDGCVTDVATSISELGGLYSECDGFPFGMGVCGVDRVCHPGG